MDEADQMRRLQRLAAAQACRNLIGRFQFCNASGLRRQLCELFADDTDTVLETPWGTYFGIEGVRRRYVTEHGDRSDPIAFEKSRGKLVQHGADTEILSVSEDGDCAEGLWLSPGVDYSRDCDGSGLGALCWIRISARFVRTKAGWRIQRYAFSPICRMEPGRDWSLAAPIDFARVYPNSRPDVPRGVSERGADACDWGYPLLSTGLAEPAPTGAVPARLRRLEAAQACRNLAGRFSAAVSSRDGKRISDLFCRDADPTIRIDANKLSVAEAVRRLCPGDGTLPGIHSLDTAVVSAAPDGKRARGAWRSIGILTPPPEVSEPAQWRFHRMSMEIVPEGGEWKIASLDLSELLRIAWDGRVLYTAPDENALQPPMPPQEREDKMEQIRDTSTETQLRRMEATESCRNLIGCLSTYCRIRDRSGLRSVWSRRGDEELLTRYGRLRGNDAALGLLENLPLPAPDTLTLHQAGTEVMIYDASQDKVAGIWLSPGFTFRREEGRFFWEWNKTEAEFVSEQDGWKLHALRIYPLLRSSICDNFAVQSDLIDADGTEMWTWAPDRFSPLDQPPIPALEQPDPTAP